MTYYIFPNCTNRSFELNAISSFCIIYNSEENVFNTFSLLFSLNVIILFSSITQKKENENERKTFDENAITTTINRKLTTNVMQMFKPVSSFNLIYFNLI